MMAGIAADYDRCQKMPRGLRRKRNATHKRSIVLGSNRRSRRLLKRRFRMQLQNKQSRRSLRRLFTCTSELMFVVAGYIREADKWTKSARRCGVLNGGTSRFVR